MKYNEKFSKEEITHFDRKIQELIKESYSEWLSLVQWVSLYKKGYCRVIQYLNDKFNFGDKTSYRFINYLRLTSWFDLYQLYLNKFEDEEQSIFKLTCSVALIDSRLKHYSIAAINFISSEYRNEIIEKLPKNIIFKDNVRIVGIRDKYFGVDKKLNHWPIELLIR